MRITTLFVAAALSAAAIGLALPGSSRANLVCDVAMVMPGTMFDPGTPANWFEGTTGATGRGARPATFTAAA